MSRRDGHSAICAECGNLTKVPFIPDGIRPVYCEDCLARKQGREPQNTVSEMRFQKSFKVKLDKDEQVLSALDTVGEAFRHHGGATLMLTEHVENGIDAVEDLRNINNLNSHDGKIEVILDEQELRVIIIDNGTGIIDPIWIMENPLKSRKTGESHQHGEFGRGLQGFRGFCRTLEYITKRDVVSQKELADPDIKKWLEEARKQGIDGKCIKLELSKDTIVTVYKPVSEKEFQKYTNNKTGSLHFFLEALRTEKKLIKQCQALPAGFLPALLTDSKPLVGIYRVSA